MNIRGDKTEQFIWVAMDHKVNGIDLRGVFDKDSFARGEVNFLLHPINEGAKLEFAILIHKVNRGWPSFCIIRRVIQRVGRKKLRDEHERKIECEQDDAAN